MTIGLYEDNRGLWRNVFADHYPVAAAQDGDGRRWTVLIIAPGTTPRRVSADTLIAPGNENKKIAATQRITYGLSAKDTVTVSSIGDGCLIISLRRALLDINGNEIEPREWRAVKHPNWSIEQTMAFETLKTLLNNTI